MNITLTIEAAPSLLAVLEKISANLGSSSESPETPGEEKKTRKPRTPKEESPSVTPTPAPSTPAPATIDDGLDDEPKIWTPEEVRALGRTEASRVGADKVRGLIKEIGFDKLPDMTADKYAEFAEKVVKLVK